MKGTLCESVTVMVSGPRITQEERGFVYTKIEINRVNGDKTVTLAELCRCANMH